MKRLMTVLFAALASVVFAGDVFYWQVAYNEWGDYGDPANWSLAADGYSNPDQRIPGADDTLFYYNNRGGAGTWYYNYGKFDLGGEVRTVANFVAEKTYRGTSLDLRNGTLRIHDASQNQQSTGRYDIREGATLVYEDAGKWVMPAGNGTMDQWVIYAGGRGEMYGQLRLGGVPGRICYQVKDGGTLIFDPTGFNTSGNNYGNDGVYFENSGTFVAPHGINWNAQSTNADGTQKSTYGGVDPMRFVQKAGTMLLGGDFCKTALNLYYPGNMRFELVGGTLAITNSVSFYTAEEAKDAVKGWGDQVFVSMPDNAAATVDVKVGSSIDMSPFTYGANAALVKDGPGKMTLGTSRPSSLTVKAGVLAFKGALTDLSEIVFEDGAILEFPQPNTELATIDNAANMGFTVGEGFVAGDTVLRTGAALAEAVAANMVMPAYLSECEARAVNGAVVLFTVPKVTIAVRDFVQVMGTEAKNGGVSVTGLQRGDTLENAFSGTLAYSYGDYTTESPVGTYEVSVSGLTSEKYQITYVPGTMTVVDASTPAVFYWKGGNQYLDFADLSNWAFSQDLATPATRLPCERDSLWIKCAEIAGGCYDGCFDLGGGSYSFAKLYGAGGTQWQQGYIGLKNGVLTIVNPSYTAMGLNHAPRYEIFDGATLVYPYATEETHLSPSGLQERWVIHSGGRGEIYNYHLFCGTTADLPAIDVQEGGTLVLDPVGFGTSAVNFGPHGARFVNNGTMILPHGINWCNESSSADSTGMIGTPKDRIRFRQMGGTMVLGGDVCKTKRNVTFIGELVFELAGGTLQVENDVRFYTADAAKDAAKGWGEQVFAEMPEGAAATVDVKTGGSIDMSVFTFGAGAALVKQGAGRMTLGAARPSSLDVKAGEICFATALTDLTGITLAEGATVVFGAANNVLAALPDADKLNYTLSDDFPLGQTVFTSSDADLVATVFGRLTVGAGAPGTPVLVNGRIVYRSKTPIVVTPRPRTIVVGTAAHDAGYLVDGEPSDRYAGAITGEPVYDFGGYAAGTSAAGTYEISVSGLSSEGFELTFGKGTLTVINPEAARVFYWTSPIRFADFGDIGNWSYSSDFTEPATRLPCEIDALWVNGVQHSGNNYYTGLFDLGGSDYSFYHYDVGTGATENWKRTHVDVTNGTLTVVEPGYYVSGVFNTTHSRDYTVWNGGTLVYPFVAASSSVLAPSGLTETWTVKAGGRVEVYNWPVFQNEIKSSDPKFATQKIEAGGTVVLDPYQIGIASFNEYGVTFENRGTLIAPHGVNWGGAGYNLYVEKDRLRFRQSEGVMLLGGDFRKTGKNMYVPGEMTFELAGGVLEVTNAVSFYTAESAYNVESNFYEQVFAEMPEGASATIDVMAGSSIDMTPFTYGANAALVKDGPGSVTFGSVLPSALTVNGGTVTFAAPTAETEPSMIAIGSGFTGRFRLRVWKDGAGDVVNDTIDFGEGLSGDFQIKPQLYGFRLKAGETIRLGAWPAASELPAATFADRNWTFCRVDGDPDSVYLRYTPVGGLVILR